MNTPRARYEVGIVIEGDQYQVEIITLGPLPTAVLTPDEARDLAWQLEDASHEPPHCERRDCDRYGVAYGLCDYHAAVAK